MQKIQLISCDAKRPDRRAIANMIEEVSNNVDGSLASELTDILLDGDSVEIIVDDKHTSSAYRAIRKLSIDYELLD